jgi:RNA polymerase sigma factor for flagellar operon FliA
MIAQHLPLVHFLARKLMLTRSGTFELNDMLDAGTIGLIHAVETFDASRGYAFSTFAAPRIRGAMLDDLRKWDDAPRTVRRKQRDLARAQTTLESRLGRSPSVAEVARETHTDVQTIWSWRAAVREATQISLDQCIGAEDSDTTHADFLSAGTGTETEDELARAEEVRYLTLELARLSEREQIILTLYFFQGLKLVEIAQFLGLTESRVSQIRTGALATLRRNMKRLRGG